MIPVSDLITRLHQRDAQIIALQAPEGLKRKLPNLAEDLRKAGFSVIISGDPCYGACDLSLDLLHFADILVHIGHAPVDDQDRVLYEYIPMDFSMEYLAMALPLLTETRIGLVTTIQHVHLIPEMQLFFRENGIEAVLASGTRRTPLPGQVLGCSFEAARNTGTNEIVFVGTGLFHPTGVQISTGARVVACDPYTRTASVVDGERLLRRRFALIEKARSAHSIGIILSSKSGQCRREMAEHLLSLSEKAELILLREVTSDQLLNSF